MMGLLEDLQKENLTMRGTLQAALPMSGISWFRTGGPAEVFFQPADEDDLAIFLKNLPQDIAMTAVGLGSNLIVRDGGIQGVVIRLSAKGFGAIAPQDNFQIRAGAAAPDVRVAKAAAEAGIAGLAFFRGIPGSIGGALRMNGGAYSAETKDVLIKARALDRSGKIHVLKNSDFGFSYRNTKIPSDFIFTEALFQGKQGEREDILKQMQEVQEKRESTQPVKTRTGGSTFKNPPGHKAWQLIDAAGCRNLRIGGAHMSELHCNFMINDEGATAFDIETLGETVRKRVFENSGVLLEWEIKRMGEFEPNKEVEIFRPKGEAA
jgi:UDP-N-acetylmuramate dehydrogenase